jgi:hypothetical protein
MAVEQFRDGRHPKNSTRVPGFPLVGLRSKTSLGRGVVPADVEAGPKAMAFPQPLSSHRDRAYAALPGG